MRLLTAAEVADLLTEIGQRLELAGESEFKAKAYYRAAAGLRALDEPLVDVVARGGLREIPGVGEAIEEKILALHRTGTHRTLERLRADYPAGVLELLKVPGLRPKKAAALYRELGITDLEALERAARAGELGRVKSLGARLEAKILEGLDLLRRTAGLMHLPTAVERAEEACALLARERSDLGRIVAAGPVRRACEVVDRIVVVAAGTDDKPIPAGLPAEVRIVRPEQHGLALLFATGSDAHLEELAGRAATLGLSLTETGLSHGGQPVPCPTEEAVYAALGLPWIPPELREGRGEVARALAGLLPRLVEERDVKGILHSHTRDSDGVDTLEAMAEAVRARGWQYFGVCDHSQSAFYAGGLKEDRIRSQHAEADRLNAGCAGTGFRILKGIESDIRPDGSLDYPEDVLEAFDFVVASVHSQFKMEREAQTERILRAVRNPFTTILGHMTGRLLLRREGYPVDVERVLAACAAHGVAVEINANPWRLDLDWRWHQRALELGCLLSIDPDAHSIAELDYVRWGVAIARKGGVPPERILTCLDLAALEEHLARRRSRHGT